MHKSKITMIVLTGIGIIATLLPFRTVSIFGISASFKGIDHWSGYVGICVMAAILGLSISGKKEEVIQKGVAKMGILIFAGIGILFALFLEAAYAMNSFDSAGFGLHLFLVASIGCLVAPFLFKADGSVSMPSRKEIADDIEESADIAEDEVEDFADHIEDKIEDRFEKDDDDDDKKKSESKSEDKSSEEGSSEEAPKG